MEGRQEKKKEEGKKEGRTDGSSREGITKQDENTARTSGPAREAKKASCQAKRHRIHKISCT